MAKSKSFGKRDEEEEDDSSWIETYADAVTLLMAFFVLLYAMSDIDKAKFETLSLSIRHVLAGHDTGAGEGEGVGTWRSENLTDGLRESLASEVKEGLARVRQTPTGIELEFNNSTLFRVGSAALRNGIKPKMREVAKYIANLPDRYSIEVEGHTDDVPIKTPRYPDNWELSAARATAVVRYLATMGVQGGKMKAIGLADTRPKRPNKTPDGSGLPLNRSQNRRVTIQILQY
jgi:chemotaxis protein MotB